MARVPKDAHPDQPFFSSAAWAAASRAIGTR